MEGMLGGHSGRRGYHRLLSGLPGSHPWTMAPPPGSTPSRTGGFLGTTSPGPMAELYGAANQDSGVSSYISAASPAPSTGFGHSLGVSGWTWRTLKLKEGEALSVCGGRREVRDDGWRECHQPRNSEGYHSVIQWTFNDRSFPFSPPPTPLAPSPKPLCQDPSQLIVSSLHTGVG